MKNFGDPMRVGELTIALKCLKHYRILSSGLNAFDQEKGGTRQPCYVDNVEKGVRPFVHEVALRPQRAKGLARHANHKATPQGSHLNSNFFLDLQIGQRSL